MTTTDRERWNAKYRAGSHQRAQPDSALLGMEHWLPSSGRALDVAGGAGADALWLAGRGLAVTMVDVSEVALGLAVQRAAERGVDVNIVQADLTREPLPPGPWELVLCNHYLQRDLLPAVGQALGVGGCLAWIHPTVRNLERHARPSRRFLLDPGEAPQLVEAAGLEIVWQEHAWVGPEQRAQHLARVVARRPTA